MVSSCESGKSPGDVAMLSHERYLNLLHEQATVMGYALQEAVDLSQARCDWNFRT